MKKYELPKEFGEKWLEALRSGDYKQGCGSYYDPINGCYCAMGIGIKANNLPLNERGDNVADGYGDPIMDNAPLEQGNRSLWFSVYDLNDNENKTFPEIADWIEANVEFI